MLSVAEAHAGHRIDCAGTYEEVVAGRLPTAIPGVRPVIVDEHAVVEQCVVAYAGRAVVVAALDSRAAEHHVAYQRAERTGDRRVAHEVVRHVGTVEYGHVHIEELVVLD